MSILLNTTNPVRSLDLPQATDATTAVLTPRNTLTPAHLDSVCRSGRLVAAYASNDGHVVVRLTNVSRQDLTLFGSTESGVLVPVIPYAGGGDRQHFGKDAPIKAFTNKPGTRAAALTHDGKAIRFNTLKRDAANALWAQMRAEPAPINLRAELLFRLPDGRDLCIARDAAQPYGLGTAHTAFIGTPGAMQQVEAQVKNVPNGETITVGDLTIDVARRFTGGPLGRIDGQAIETVMPSISRRSVLDRLGVEGLKDGPSPKTWLVPDAADVARANAGLTDAMRGLEVQRAWLSPDGKYAVVRCLGKPGDKGRRGTIHVIVDVKAGTGEPCCEDVSRNGSYDSLNLTAKQALLRLRDGAPVVTGGKATQEHFSDANALGISSIITDDTKTLVAVREGLPPLAFIEAAPERIAPLFANLSMKAPQPEVRANYVATLADGRTLVIARDYNAGWAGRPHYVGFVGTDDAMQQVPVDVSHPIDGEFRLSAAGAHVDIPIYSYEGHPDTPRLSGAAGEVHKARDTNGRKLAWALGFRSA